MDQLINVTIQKLKLDPNRVSEQSIRNVMRFLMPVMALFTWIIICVNSEAVANVQAISAGVIICGLFLIRAMSDVPFNKSDSTENN